MCTTRRRLALIAFTATTTCLLGLPALIVWERAGAKPSARVGNEKVPTAGPIRADAGPPEYAASILLQILFPLVTGLALKSLHDRWKGNSKPAAETSANGQCKPWWRLLFSYRGLQLLVGFSSWKYGCDLGFLWVQGVPERAWDPWGLASYTLVQFFVYHWLCELFLRDGLLGEMGFEADRPPEPQRRHLWALMSKSIYENDDGTSVSAPPVHVVTKPFIVLAAASYSWPAYDVGSVWASQPNPQILSTYLDYEYPLLWLFTLGGYFGRIFFYYVGEVVHVLALRRTSSVVGWDSNSGVGRLVHALMRYQLDMQFVLQRALAVLGVGLLLPTLAWMTGMAGPWWSQSPTKGQLVAHGSPVRLPNSVRAGPTAAKPSADESNRDEFLHVERPVVGEHQGKVRVSVDPGEVVFYTDDGSIPSVRDGVPQGTTKPFREPLVFDEPTILRAVAYRDGDVSPVRSVAVTPNLWTARLSKLPLWGLGVKAVYVTGEFRDWSPAFDDQYLMKKQADGSYTCRVMIDGSTDVQYKYIVRYLDGSHNWYTDPNSSVIGSPEGYENNLISPVLRVADKLHTANDGLIEEGFLDASRLEKDTRHVELVLGALEGDVESVKVEFEGVPAKKMWKTTYGDGEPRYASYSLTVEIPDEGLDIRYSFVVKDRQTVWRFGPLGPQPARTGQEGRKRNQPYEDTFRLHFAPREDRNRDFRSRTIYFVMVDRFCDGNSENNQGHNPESFDPKNLRKYQGGDLQGIRNNVGYLQSLNIGAIWVTPLVNNIDEIDYALEGGQAAYHGYWAEDSFDIDEHLGTFDDLGKLVDDMRACDVKLVLDYAPNHSSPAWLGDLLKGGRLLESQRLLVKSVAADEWKALDEQWYHHFGDIPPGGDGRYPDRVVCDPHGLADFRQEAPHVARYLIEAGKFWLDRGADAFRIDSLKHIDPHFACRFSRAMRDYGIQSGRDEVYICGEWAYGGTSARTLERLQTLLKGVENLDLLDFSLQEMLRAALTGHTTMRSLGAHVQKRREGFLGRDSWQPIFLDNHDTSRIAWHLRYEAAGGGMDAETVKRRVDLGLVLIMTLPGIPTIYYGTEQYQGLELAGPEATQEPLPGDYRALQGRAMMASFDTGQPAFQIIRRLARLRRTSPAVQRGLYEEKYADDDTLVYQRTEDGQVVVVAVNRGPKTKVRVSGLDLPDGTYPNLLLADVDGQDAGEHDSPVLGPKEVQVAGRTGVFELPANGAAVLHGVRADKPAAVDGPEP